MTRRYFPLACIWEEALLVVNRRVKFKGETRGESEKVKKKRKTPVPLSHTHDSHHGLSFMIRASDAVARQSGATKDSDVLGRGRSKIIKFLGPSTRCTYCMYCAWPRRTCTSLVHKSMINNTVCTRSQLPQTISVLPSPSLPQSSSSPSPSSSSPPLLPHPKSFYSITTGPSSESFRPIITLPHSISRSSHEI
ncbi:hypothetical protein EYC84_005694 [Monilinia fructicola]|uniref:Uncharacterized protein n=1 Tax=Monilinia fructicola TaxID=38448 RepID=A0A5M9JZV8_MONFR|nr:hypothetical protein EYC84_005694 [Monilinia fructicola]